MRRLKGSPRLAALFTALLLAQAAFGAVAAIRAAGWLEPLELLAYDRFLAVRVARSAPENEIVIVPISDRDWLEKFDERFIPDRDLAMLLVRLSEHGAGVIGLDLIRNRPEAGPGGTGEDYEALVRVFERYPDIVGVYGYRDEHGVGFTPPPALEGQPSRLGFADMDKDEDGVVRRGLLYLGGDGTSLALQVASRVLARDGIVPAPEGSYLRLGETTFVPLSADAGGYHGIDAAGYQLLLTYPACSAPMPTLSIEEVLSGAPSLDGKTVLIGNQTSEAADVFQTPVGCHGPAPNEVFGVALHAQMVSQLVRQAIGAERPLQTPQQLLRSTFQGEFVEYGWMWLWSTAGGMVMTAPGLALATGLLVATLAALIAASFAAFVGLGWWLPVVPPALAMVSAAILVLGHALVLERLRITDLMRTFASYVSARVVDVILRSRDMARRGKPPPPTELTATVLFSDIRGFTTISEAMPERALMAWLNEYTAAMADLVTAHGGVIEKFAGDGMTAEFGVPEPRISEVEIAADARAAVDCALAMGRRLALLNRDWERRGLPVIGIRVGIHTGKLVVGNLGSDSRMQFSIIGDTANTAARLESFKAGSGPGCDDGHCRILISEATWLLLDGRYEVALIGPLSLKGKQRAITAYRLWSDSDLNAAEAEGGQA